MEVSDEMVLADGALCSFGENLQHWLTDETARDQFVIHSSTGLEVYWNSTGQMEPELVDHRPFFTQKFVKWSPQGTYLATVHPPCASVWGGPTFFNPLMCYDHRKVELIDFSPGEKYLVTQCVSFSNL
ncbi:hypothetical protein L1049_001436 [Liquidambar formosana]|uniref:Uncharacterized protein n=1 Tax=Liquidambar formosana TaxID=63359 RepID=A0AAP0NB28_LIQFO